MINIKKSVMKIKLQYEITFKLLHPNYRKIRYGLDSILNVTRSTVWYMLRKNEINGRLTCEAVLQYLETELNMARHQLIEIVED